MTSLVFPTFRAAELEFNARVVENLAVHRLPVLCEAKSQ